MVEQGVFVAKLAKALQMLCHGYLEYNSTIEIIGHINLRIDNQKYDYIVNEQVSRQGGESTFFQSNSYHSLPPGKCCQTGDRQHSGRFEDDSSMSNHQRMSDALAAMGGNCVKVDLSGPVPYTHSTHLIQPCLSQESCFSSANSGGGANRRRSHRDSRLRSMEEDQATVALHLQDHSFNHSSASSKDREIEMNGNGDISRTDAASVLAMYKDMERLRQQRQDMIIKAEPNDRTDSEVEDQTAGVDSLMRDDVMESSAVTSILPTAHQSALAAHTGHTLMSTNTMAHHSFFDASSLASQDMSEVHPGDSSYRPVAIANTSASGQDLSKQSPQNGEAMSLVVRSRTPPDLNYPSGPTQLPQTADVGNKDGSISSEKNRCDHCSKYFRTADLLSMHIALIHSRHNYMSPKALRNNPSYMPSPRSPSSQSSIRRTSQSPGHQSTSSSSSRSKSQSPIAVMSHSHTQPLALAHSLSSLPTSMGMSLPTLPSTMSSSPHSSPTAATNVAAAMAAAAFVQSYSMEPSQVGPMRSSQDGGSLGSQAYQCHMCHMPFVSWALLAQHQSQCPRRGPHRCDQCGKAFRSKTSLTDHVNTIHRGMVFICKGCRESFKWRTHIYQHKRKCQALQNANFESGSFFIEEVMPHHQQAIASPSMVPSLGSDDIMDDPEPID